MNTVKDKNNQNLVKQFFDNYVHKFDYIYETQYSEQNPIKRFLDKLLRKSMIDRFNLTKRVYSKFKYKNYFRCWMWYWKIFILFWIKKL